MHKAYASWMDAWMPMHGYIKHHHIPSLIILTTESSKLIGLAQSLMYHFMLALMQIPQLTSFPCS